MDAGHGGGHDSGGWTPAGDGGDGMGAVETAAFGAYFAVFIGTWMLTVFAFHWRGSWKAWLGLPIGLAVAFFALLGAILLAQRFRRLRSGD